jgi:gluconolactonase
VVVDSQGRIWFTDPTFGRIRPALGIIREPELSFRGVFRIDVDGSIHLVADDFNQPNGLCFSPDESLLYVNDSWDSEIRVFNVAPDGELASGRRFAKVTGEGEGVPDGMKVDIAGNVFCNGPGGIHVFGPGGSHCGLIEVPEKSANFCFGGADLQSLFITASTSVYRVRTKTRGPAALPRQELPA